MTKTVSRPAKTKIPSEEGRKSESLQQISTFICVNRIAFFLLLNCFLFVLPITGTYVLKDSLWAEGERAAGSLPYIRIVAFLMGAQQKKKTQNLSKVPSSLPDWWRLVTLVSVGKQSEKAISRTLSEATDLAKTLEHKRLVSIHPAAVVFQADWLLHIHAWGGGGRCTDTCNTQKCTKSSLA